MFLGKLAASLLGSALTGTGVIIAKWKFLISPHPLNYFKLQKYYQNEAKFNGVDLKKKISKIKDGTYIINLDEHKPIGTHLKASYVNGKNVRYYDSFGVGHISEEIGLHWKKTQIFIAYQHMIHAKCWFDQEKQNIIN